MLGLGISTPTLNEPRKAPILGSFGSIYLPNTDSTGNITTSCQQAGRAHRRGSVHLLLVKVLSIEVAVHFLQAYGIARIS